MAEETKNDAVAPSIEVKSSNEEHVMHDTRFTKSNDEVERNDIPMDVNIGMEASRNLQLVEKHMTKELKDDYSNDDPVIDIVKLLVPQLCWQNAQARWIKHDKKWNQFKLPNNDILIDYANGSQPLYSIKWPDVDIMHVPINVRASHGY
ncbi:hypothetical protein CK203_091267 [Vitis vinifera]|uniref:Uncharacterized protein n=1 Tax=Vitis vinifera TaxID=29760 RepID=A0A438DRL7_VITVI|nr:hypothetical protein CK203_091267 [Vitis vinifera]